MNNYGFWDSDHHMILISFSFGYNQGFTDRRIERDFQNISGPGPVGDFQIFIININYYYYNLLLILVLDIYFFRSRSGPRTEPLGSRRTGFGSWIPGYNDVGDGRYSRNMLVWDVGDRISVSIAKVIWCCPLNLTMKVRFLLLAIFISHHKNPWLMGSIVQTCIFTVE